MARDLTGERLKAAERALQDSRNGKVAGDQFWNYLRAHETEVRALVREAERAPRYTAEEEAALDSLVFAVAQYKDEFFDMLADWINNHQPADEQPAA